MSSIKVTYFDIEGAAEKLRLALCVCNKDFEDNRIDYVKEWGTMKSSMPYEQLPVLEITEADGSTKTLAQSPALLKWIARKFDNSGTLYPTDPSEMMKVEGMLGLSDDLAKAFMPSVYLGFENFDHSKFGHPADWPEREATVKHVQEKFMANDLSRFMKYFSDAIEKNGNLYVAGINLTIADLQFLVQTRQLCAGWAKHVPKDCLEAFPVIMSWLDRMYSIPQIRRWYKMDHDMSIKLTYFNIAGAAEKLRLALAYCRKEFEDERIGFQDWPSLKATLPYGQVPVMNVSDPKTGRSELFTQSGGMLRWIAMKFDSTGRLLPHDNEKMLKVEEMIGLSDDLAKAWGPSLYLGMRHEIFGHPQEWPEKDEVVKTVREKFLSTELPKFMRFFTTALKNTGETFLAADHVTIADLQVLPQLQYFTKGIADHVPADCLDAYPVVTQWIERMLQIPQINQWYNK